MTHNNEALIVENIALVGHIVRETMARVPSHVDRDDLTSAGLTSLVHASHAFDAERGVPFHLYAATRVRGAIADELRRVDWASRSVRRRSRELDATRAELAMTLGRVATPAEVAQAAGLTPAEVATNDHEVARAQVFSLNAADADPIGERLVCSSPDPLAAVVHREQISHLTDAIAELPERLRLVVEQHFLAERPLTEIAAVLGVSHSRVSQLRARALERLRDALGPEVDAERDLCGARRRGTHGGVVTTRRAPHAPSHARHRERRTRLDVRH
ncbi:sigma-70 family RNA polymerase sigma factor [Nocardioides sp. SR21]|uniref:sigma-70 family RNA polymerase sigma factor n=1 Tax=Nocardioides sp. SR21 TaxID=2919501 RepID=UPI001FA9B8D1|nr:sigma-70 family RNA polymerase sigma factor [Nocardioides sp. SR21]